MKTSYSHSTRDGHCAETEIDLGERHVLTILTRKNTNGTLVSMASVSEGQGGIRMHITKFDGSGDFRATVAQSTPKRVTANAVQAQHDQALATVDAIKLAVKRYYEAQANKDAAHA